ncbi:MAG: DUF368 domain-containing protein [Sphaerochaetaceae bacterium]|nr:DUF368 domain-containing protein [Sphaerochaetaceae bacterium]
MALADSIPGISGGTVAYILGFYDLFIDSLDNLLRGSSDQRKEAIKFIIPLGIGWVIGMGLCVSILSTLFSNHIYIMSSLLIGLTLFSIPIILREEKKTFDRNTGSIIKNLAFFLIGFTLVVMITYLSSKSYSTKSLDGLNVQLALYLFIAGDIAISTMVLPGISGSSLLMILGLYLPIISGLKKFFSFDFSAVPSLFIFGLGVLFGIFTTIRLVRKALDNHRSATMSFIIGLIVAATYSISMGPTTLEVAQAPLNLETFSLIAFIIGGIPIFILNYVKAKKENLNIIK